MKGFEYLVSYSKANLGLANAKLDKEYYYKSLPLCVIDAVFSIGIRYSTTSKVVRNFAWYNRIELYREKWDKPEGEAYPDINEQYSINEFIGLYQNHGLNFITNNIYKNRCRTSPKSGILKSEASCRFAETLQKYGVNYFQDLDKIKGNSDFEKDIKSIPGQGSGICLNYFYILVGDKNKAKLDRMILRFVNDCMGDVDTADVNDILERLLRELQKDYPDLTLRLLDLQIWEHQREQEQKSKVKGGRNGKRRSRS